MSADDYMARQDVLGLALDLHMWKTGSGPDLQAEHRDHAIFFLENRLANWSSSGKHDAVFDQAVRLLLTVAVSEAKDHRERWSL